MIKRNLLILFFISHGNNNIAKNIIRKEQSLKESLGVKKADIHSILSSNGKVLVQYAMEDEVMFFDIISKNIFTLVNDASGNDFRSLTFESNNGENKDTVIVKIFNTHVVLEQSSQMQQNFNIRKDGQNSFMHSSSFSSSSGSSSQVLPIPDKKKADLKNIDVNFLSDEHDNNIVNISSNEFYFIIPLIENKIEVHHSEKNSKKIIKNIKDVKR